MATDDYPKIVSAYLRIEASNGMVTELAADEPVNVTFEATAPEPYIGWLDILPPVRIEPPESYHVRMAFDSNPRLGVQRAPLRISHRKKAELPPEVNRDQLAEALTQIADHSSDGDIRDHLRTVIRALNGSGVLFVNGPAQQVMRET